MAKSATRNHIIGLFAEINKIPAAIFNKNSMGRKTDSKSGKGKITEPNSIPNRVKKKISNLFLYKLWTTALVCP